VSTFESQAGVQLRITALVDEPGLSVEGDVDFRSLDEFSAAITEAVALHPGDIVIDLGKLTFIEVSGMRVLADTARQLADQDRRLVLRDLAPHLQPVLKVVGWYDNAEPG
jgi:anti-anti-sigma factor